MLINSHTFWGWRIQGLLSWMVLAQGLLWSYKIPGRTAAIWTPDRAHFQEGSDSYACRQKASVSYCVDVVGGRLSKGCSWHGSWFPSELVMTERENDQYHSCNDFYHLISKVACHHVFHLPWSHRPAPVQSERDCTSVWVLRDRNHWGSSWRLAITTIRNNNKTFLYKSMFWLLNIHFKYTLK